MDNKDTKVSIKEKITHFFCEEKVSKIVRIISIASPFIAIDICTRILAMTVDYFRISIIFSSLLFSGLWIMLIVGLAMMSNKIASRIIYIVGFLLFFIMFFVHGVYYSLTDFFFNFNLIYSASEGSSYIWDTILGASPIFYAECVLIIVLAVYGFRKLPKNDKCKYREMIYISVSFCVLHICVPFVMGSANDALKWDSWRNPRNVYESFSDANKNIKVCGIYEYTIRDMYITFLKPKEEDKPEEIELLESIYVEQKLHATNEYTGIFEGRNVILLQLEGIDSWMVTREDMPNLYELMQDSMVFENHYSYYSGGGSTFNSELAVNTGLITPVSYVRTPYTFTSNLFKYSLANQFAILGYRTNAFHMNSGEFYSRGLNYKNWGYESYNGLLENNKYDDLSYELDRELIQDEEFYEKMFRGEEPFLHYIITYTPHTPFDSEGDLGKYLCEVNGDEDKIGTLSGKETALYFASETDKMIDMLMQALEDNGLLENTVIVGYTDHYLYTLEGIEEIKGTNDNLINNTPFFIWSYDMEPVKIEKVNAQIDILPTVLNMFGIIYDENYYIGNDIFDSEFTGYVFFSDYSWYDGNVYVADGEVKYGEGISEEQLKEMNTLINSIIQKNDLTLKYDYFRRIN